MPASVSLFRRVLRRVATLWLAAQVALLSVFLPMRCCTVHDESRAGLDSGEMPHAPDTVCETSSSEAMCGGGHEHHAPHHAANRDGRAKVTNTCGHVAPVILSTVAFDGPLVSPAYTSDSGLVSDFADICPSSPRSLRVAPPDPPPVFS